jgi:ATP-dependent RNA helicase RhlE
MTFTSLKIADFILKALQEEGYTQPTPVQGEAIPIVLDGTDLLACAQTGTGKTAAFAIPIIQLLNDKAKLNKDKKIRSLIVTPTRELAIQIGESFASYGRHGHVKHAVVFGGVKQESQVRAIKSGIDVLIATPGRLLDLIQQGYISLSSIELFVLDEADRMLDMGFINDIRKLLKLLPQRRQSLFFSATMPPEIVKLADNILYKPKKVEVTPVSSTAETINQSLYFVDKTMKNALMLDLLQDDSIKTVLVFTRTKHGADKVVKVLQRSNIKAAAIHGNKSQNARQNALKAFKEQTLRVLVATDIAARGIDVDELEWVINYDIPNIPETYVHRIGRTGRAGNKGSAISFCSGEERPWLKDIERLINLKIPLVFDHPFQDKGQSNDSKPQQATKPLAKTGEQGPRKPGGHRPSGNKSYGNKPKKKGVYQGPRQ